MVIGNRNVERGEETVSMIREAGGVASFQRTDVVVAAEVEALVDHAVKTCGRLDVAFKDLTRRTAGTYSRWMNPPGK